MAAFRGWAVLPVIGTGALDDAVRPDLRGVATAGDRTEHVIVEGFAWCLVACEIADDTRLAAGEMLASHDDLETLLESFPKNIQNKISRELAKLDETDISGSVRDILRRAGRRLGPGWSNFDPAEHLQRRSAPPSGSFVNDTFTDTAGTTVQAHTGETGATWTKHPLANATIDGLISAAGRVYSNDPQNFNTWDAQYYASGLPATAEYTVEASVWVGDNSFAANTGTESEVHLWARMDTAAITGYNIEFYRNGVASSGSGAITFRRWSGGSQVSIGTYSPALTAGENDTVTLECLDATKKVYWNGVEVISSANNDITAAGRAGFGTRNITPEDGGLQLENFTATDAGAVGEALVRAVGEMMGLAGVRQRLLQLSRVATDPVGSAESASRPRGLNRLRAENQAVDEDRLFARTLARIRADSLNLAEEVGLTRGLQRVKTEALLFTETTNSLLTQIGQALSRIVSEASTISEVSSRIRSLFRIRSESSSIISSQTKIRSLLRFSSDSLGLASILSKTRGLSRAKTETGTTAEMKSTLLEQAILRIVNSTIALATQTGRIRELARLRIESIAGSEIVKRSRSLSRIRAEINSLVEAQLKSRAISRIRTTTVGLTSNISKVRGFVQVINDAVGIVTSFVRKLSDRIFTIPSHRIVSVASEDRSVTVASEDRSVIAESDPDA